MNDKVSKDFLEWYQERIKGMTPEEFKNYVLGRRSTILLEFTEHHREMIDKIAAGKMPSGWYSDNGLYGITPMIWDTSSIDIESKSDE